MILDFENDSLSLESLRADVCVAGGGAAGITLALESERHGMTVLLIEGGGEQTDTANDTLLRTEPGSRRYDSPQTGRARVLGGATTLWAGQMLPLDAGDFESRDWVDGSGWPISAVDLSPYNRRVEVGHGLAAATYDARSWPEELHDPPSLRQDLFQSRYSVFLRDPRFNVVYGDRLRRSTTVTVLTHANVTCIEANEDGRIVRSLRIRSLSGRTGNVSARHFVIACGGIDTPRLLLASPHGAAGGHWNRHDVIGRYFHDHAHMSARIAPVDRESFGRIFHTRRIGGVRHYPKIAASSVLQRREQLLAVGADVCYERNPGSPTEALKTLASASRDPSARPDAPAAMLSLVRHPTEVGRALHRSAVLKQKPSEGASPPRVCVQCESPPDPESRITLSDATDALGVPLARVDWRIDVRTETTICRFVQLLATEFSRHRLAAIDQSGLIAPGPDEGLSARIDAGHHHMGATRMSVDPRHGVVDPNSTVHGVANLHIASTSVFPVSGFSNPTFTMLALTIRLADRVKELCGR